MIHQKREVNNRIKGNGSLRHIGFLLLMLAVMAVLLGAFWQLRLKGYTYREEFRVQEGVLFTPPFEEIYGVGLSDDRGKKIEKIEDYQSMATVTFSILNEDGAVVYAKTAEEVRMDQPGTVIAGGLITKSFRLLPEQKYSIRLEDETGERTDMTVFLYGEEKSPRSYYMGICVLILLVTLLGGIFYLHSDHIPLRISAPCMFLALGLLWELALAPLSAPDEMAHFSKAYQLSNHWLGEQELDEDSYPLVEGTGLQKLEFNGNFQYMMHFWEDTQGNEKGSYYSYSEPPYIASNIPYYLPAAAITICRLLGASYQWIVISGRIVNLLLYTLVLWLALRMAPGIHERLFASICFLPGIGSVACSYSYDIWTNAFVFLFMAVCLHCRDVKRKLRWRDGVTLVIFAALMTPVKIIYILMIPAIYLIPRDRFKKRWHRPLLLFSAFLAAGVLLIGIQWRALSVYLLPQSSQETVSSASLENERESCENEREEILSLRAVGQVASEDADALPDMESSYTEQDSTDLTKEGIAATESSNQVEENTAVSESDSQAEEAGELQTEEIENAKTAEDAQKPSGFTVGWILQHLVKTIYILAGDLFEETDYLLKQCLMGNGLPLHASSDLLFFGVLTVFLLLMTQGLPGDYVTGRERFAGIAMFLIGVLTVQLTFLITTTGFWDEGVSPIRGIQGRYFIPYLLFLPFILQNRRIILKEQTQQRLFWILPFLNVCTALSTIAYVAAR